MAHKTAVINVVGLSESVLGAHTPNLNTMARDHGMRRLRAVLPAVTCSVQSSMLTGEPVSVHGIVGNGWYEREQAEVRFWKQNNGLVRAEKVWETARRREPGLSCLNMFWWYNMHSSADASVTPRPIYKADGRKIPDVYSEPPELRDELQQELGRFPLFRFWGPAASIESSRWIAEATVRVWDRSAPDLTLVYLPHLDYGLQKFGPGDPRMEAELRAIDDLFGWLRGEFERRGVRMLVVSEYGIEPVTDAVWLNRELRRAGLLHVREEDGLELLDPGASRAFAVVDHQIAHVYVRDAADTDSVRSVLLGVAGVAEVLDHDEQAGAGIAHVRSGDLVCVSEAGRWFAYGWWDNDRHAPDYARTVDIHRKPGYDPCELYLDPAKRWPKGAIAWRLLKKKLGLRTLMDVIPLDTSLVRGSHGRVEVPQSLQPVIMGDSLPGGDELHCTAVRDVILRQLFEG